MVKNNKLYKPLWVNHPSEKEIEENQGFVYLITHKPSGRYYVGTKTFWNKKTLKPLKGRKNKRHKTVESDWREYWGSSNKLKEFIIINGTNDFERRILRLCKTKFDCKYYELLEQLDRNVLFDDLSWNEIINVRLRKQKTK